MSRKDKAKALKKGESARARVADGAALPEADAKPAADLPKSRRTISKPSDAGVRSRDVDGKQTGHKVAQTDAALVLVSRALSDPTRVSILRRIATGEGRCGEMRACLGVSAATLSHHIKELERAGLITARREGRFLNASVDRKMWKRHISELKAMLPSR